MQETVLRLLRFTSHSWLSVWRTCRGPRTRRRDSADRVPAPGIVWKTFTLPRSVRRGLWADVTGTRASSDGRILAADTVQTAKFVGIRHDDRLFEISNL